MEDVCMLWRLGSGQASVVAGVLHGTSEKRLATSSWSDRVQPTRLVYIIHIRKMVVVCKLQRSGSEPVRDGERGCVSAPSLLPRGAYATPLAVYYHDACARKPRRPSRPRLAAMRPRPLASASLTASTVQSGVARHSSSTRRSRSSPSNSA